MGENFQHTKKILQHKLTFIIFILSLAWLGILFTQIYLPLGFEIMVIVGLVFTSKISFFLKENIL